MQFNHWPIGRCDGGESVIVQLVGHATNVKLLDHVNYERYRTGKQHRYYGGRADRPVSKITVPHRGDWHVVADMQGLPSRQADIGIEVVTDDNRR